jgi:selenocysteine lyase/cysteine desulfurase
MAHDHGAEVFVDAVHLAPHAPIDVAAWGCDFLACSAYKFFGPHVGILWGKSDALNAAPAYRVRPAGAASPGCWETGTQNHEGIAGTMEAIEYLASLGCPSPTSRPSPSSRPESSRRRPDRARQRRRRHLADAFAAIAHHEQILIRRLLDGLESIPGLEIFGMTDRNRLDERAPTVSFTHARRSPKEIAVQCGKQGIFVWHGNFYAVELSEALGLEPEGMVRVGLLHYNTVAEVDRLVNALTRLLG